LIDYLHQFPGLFIAVCAVVGLVIGSFLNVVILRMPRMLELEESAWLAEREGTARDPKAKPFNLFVPRSHCPACGHVVRARENIPVLSYLWLKGKCSACAARISPRYPLIEALTALLSLLVAWHFGPGWQAVVALIFLWFLIALTFIDIDTQLLPDKLTLSLLWIGLLVNLLGLGTTSLDDAVLGAVAGYSSLWLVYWTFKLVTGKEGMGYGDFKLLAAIGA